MNQSAAREGTLDFVPAQFALRSTINGSRSNLKHFFLTWQKARVLAGFTFPWKVINSARPQISFFFVEWRIIICICALTSQSFSSSSLAFIMYNICSFSSSECSIRSRRVTERNRGAWAIKRGKALWKKYNKKKIKKGTKVRKLGRLGEEHIYTVRLCYCFLFCFRSTSHFRSKIEWCSASGPSVWVEIG